MGQPNEERDYVQYTVCMYGTCLFPLPSSRHCRGKQQATVCGTVSGPRSQQQETEGKARQAKKNNREKRHHHHQQHSSNSTKKSKRLGR